jgi:hypothetical protein
MPSRRHERRVINRGIIVYLFSPIIPNQLFKPIRTLMDNVGYLTVELMNPMSISDRYRQVERPRLLAFTWLPDWQKDATETIVRFLEETDGVTTVRLTHSGLASESSRTSHKGWPQILTWLQAYVEQQV